jgi:hypothetical protein
LFSVLNLKTSLFYVVCSPVEYLGVVSGAGLWPYLLEALHSLGEREAGLLSVPLFPLLQSLPALERLVFWTGLAGTAVIKWNTLTILESECVIGVVSYSLYMRLCELLIGE